MATIKRPRQMAEETAKVKLENYTLESDHFTVTISHIPGRESKTLWLNDNDEDGLELGRTELCELIAELQNMQRKMNELEA